MARSRYDSWDLASSVGATATMVAAARALATAAPESIIDDPYAAPLVHAVGIDFFTRLVDGRIAQADLPAEQVSHVHRLVVALAVRTRFFDDFFSDAFAAPESSRQAVILAAGLDSRAYRLAWPSGSVVYEVDQPQVVDFKTAAMTKLGAEPAAQRRTVRVDLRDDWPTALRASGFIDTQPSVWSAEGLLMYLPPEAQDQLFDTITALSAPGSRLATEYHPDGGARVTERARKVTDQWRAYGYDMDLPALFYTGARNNVVDYLGERGWQVTARPRCDLFAEYGVEFPNGPDDDVIGAFRDTVSLVAVRG